VNAESGHAGKQSADFFAGEHGREEDGAPGGRCIGSFVLIPLRETAKNHSRGA
jgi:hypothetical protein